MRGLASNESEEVTISVCIATYGEEEWRDLARDRAFPSAQAEYPHEVIVKHHKRGTIASVRNACARKATGEWLVFLDADDELAPGYLDAMVFAAEKHRRQGEPILLTPIVQRILRGRSAPPSFYPEVPLLTANWLVIGTMLRRDLFLKAGGFGEYPHGFEDWALWAKCAKLGARVVKVHQAVYRQHINPRSKHRLGWKDRKWQVSTHLAVQADLDAWVPA